LNADVDITLPPGFLSRKWVGSVGEGILGQVRGRQERYRRGRIRTESVEVLHVHAMRESKQEKIELGSAVSVDERQDGG
jgi:hypothetical protein